MATANDNKTKEQAVKKYNQADEQAHKHLDTIRNTKVGRMVPTEFEKVSITQVAKVTLFLMIFANICIYGFCYALSATSTDNVNEFPGSFAGVIMTIVLLLSMAHDLYVYFTNSKRLLLSFLLLRLLSVLVVLLAVAKLSGPSGGMIFKTCLDLGYIATTLVTTYIFAIYISSLSGRAGVDPSEHQAV